MNLQDTYLRPGLVGWVNSFPSSKLVYNCFNMFQSSNCCQEELQQKQRERDLRKKRIQKKREAGKGEEGEGAEFPWFIKGYWVILYFSSPIEPYFLKALIL